MIKYAEFCAGIGGFSLGIKQSKMNAELVYVNEIDDFCEKTFYRNFSRKINSKDIFEIDPQTLPDFDMMCAGFPCQPFSQAGKTLGFNDPRGTIFFKLVEIISVKKPSIIFFENVPNLVRHDKGNTYKVISDAIEKEGYKLYTKILDSTFFGVPQSRPRVYIIGLKKDIFNTLEFDFTEKITEKTPLRGFLNHNDFSIPISDKWQEYIDLYTNVKTEDEISFELPKTRKKLERVSTNCILSDCIFQIRSSGIRAYGLDDPFPTFAVSNSGGGAMIPVLSGERRHLNLIEMKRIMGFPDDFEFPVSRTDSIKQLANAVCPAVIESICNDIKRITVGIL
ncbi:DNA (cytosine-5-)-methyltransferase [Clostridium botulinum]|uniref:DNA (cytosine-5-)-methyltransferase n=1 Tax=Clostridium botulinum TaxID=1491 RepID=UPI0006896742|nr:DNA (cytosine-5-)-methyltransferase [Clostridium botulinum]NFO97776.1 DNA (cytosine-5-)-methyltransferase [Clostridium botulinum]OOV51056.1 DNA (cytosine-5-)-methyltransferase [Clostridium botulinum D/C]OOV53944.1 DNA (cytosine-5-)-methyltransferase [Clostridium botulinum D/C]OOV54957.1 DNA (cytosine-5-)-methyltransferase [Clostridium botulinum D/C]OOV56952.1 DNA (cytosine-5-)-methyltransferase [Clostridium botulinum D/C]